MKLQTTKRPAAKPPPEKLVQARLIQRLKAEGYLVIRQNSGAHRGTAGNYFRAYIIENFPPKQQSSGLPDLAAIKAGRIYFFEVKTETGKLSEPQKYFHAFAESKGVPVWTVYGMADIDTVMNELNEMEGDVLFPPRQGVRVTAVVRQAELPPLTDEDIENALDY